MVSSIKDVAKRARVTPWAVSLVMNNKYEKQVSEDVRYRILEAARELDYHASALARGLVLNRTQNIGAILYHISYLGSPHFSAIMGGIGEAVDEYGFHLQVSSSYLQKEAGEKIPPFMRIILEKRVDGLIILDHIVNDRMLLRLKKKGIKFVLVERRIEGENISSVCVDHRKGLREATEYLISLGHCRIGFVTHDPAFFYDAREKLAGYKEALDNNGIAFKKDFVYCTASGKHLIADELIGLNGIPTAIICTQGETGIRVGNALRAKGFNIPGDISLITHGNSTVVLPTDLSLTEVNVPCHELGQLATELLIKFIEREEVEREEIVIDSKLIIKDSCAPPALKAEEVL